MTSQAGSNAEPASALSVSGVTKRFMRGKREITALNNISLSLQPGSVNGLLGPDGAGKTTLLRMAAGLMTPAEGSITVLGMDSVKDARAIQAAIGYMPQRFGLYEDLSVQENMDLYADLQSVPKKERKKQYPRLLEMTGLGPFTARLAGRLSGGMKQKLGLACSLIKTPQLLLLDEPTVGVDPLSRRELWRIVDGLVREEEITVLVSTAYLDEAERCDTVFVLLDGELLGQGAPEEFVKTAAGRVFYVDPGDELPRHVQSRLFSKEAVVDATLREGFVHIVTAKDTNPEALCKGLAFRQAEPVFEDGFMILLESRREHAAQGFDINSDGQDDGNGDQQASADKPARTNGETIIEVDDLERKFGDFYAVRGLDFTVSRGEIFGLLGPNGAGKSTTFRMLCGLLPPTGGHLEVAGEDLRTAAAKARRNVGYMAQKFSLYGQLSVRENLDFFSRAYGLYGKRQRTRVQWALESLELESEASSNSGELPFGYKQRLALACALMHEPDILFLDEPTSGVDPLARREFWQRISALADAGVTIIVTTHFMEEAEYCDRMLIMMSGELLALGTPDEIREHATGGESSIESAFIALVEQYRKKQEAA
ncbi:ATP-binding cassette domain-containing protein [Oceanidesulfovibrio marinus]|nr:ATP-binding cassette domain-containing protein [Oceanidesulfovibrio marinus]